LSLRLVFGKFGNWSNEWIQPCMNESSSSEKVYVFGKNRKKFLFHELHWFIVQGMMRTCLHCSREDSEDCVRRNS